MDYRYLALSLLSMGVVAMLTPATRLLAPRVGMMRAPRADRWHTRPTPMLGGLPMFAGVAVTLLVVRPELAQFWGILAGSALVFVLGLLDDFFHLRPFPKLIGVIAASGCVLQSGLYLPWFDSMVLNVAVTVFWLVGITNAFNLLDNMDGLAAGIAAIAALFLAISFLIGHQPEAAVLAAIMGGAVLGFLIYNFHPASIFMGDCGSMFLGFFLASLTLSSGFGRSRNLFYILAGPVMLLLLPIFDTTFVTITRIFSGRHVSEGGRDHTSHRLAQVAGSERNAVLILYGFAILSGVLSVLVRLGYFSVSFALIPTFCLVLTFVGIYLGQVSVSVSSARRDVSRLQRFLDLAGRNSIFQIGLDMVLIPLAYYWALFLRFEGRIPTGDLQLFLRVAPLLVAIKITTFVFSGVYRGIWRYFGLASMMTYVRAIALSSTLCTLTLLFIYRFGGFSRAAMVMDAALLLLMMTASRMSFQILHSTLLKRTPEMNTGGAALIYGAGELGAIVVKQLETDSSFGFVPVGFIDDDPHKRHKTIHGYRILTDSDGLNNLLQERSIAAVIVACRRLPEERLERVRDVCQAMQIPVKQMTIRIE